MKILKTILIFFLIMSILSLFFFIFRSFLAAIGNLFIIMFFALAIYAIGVIICLLIKDKRRSKHEQKQ